MLKTQTKRTRVRITRREIEKARQELLQEESSKSKSISRERLYAKDYWRDGVYYDSYGWSWGLDDNYQTICLGRAAKAKSSFPSEKENHSCHSKLKNDAPSISGGGAKFIVATFKNDPQFLTIFEGLVFSDSGIRVIASELKKRGYNVPLRTLARWIERQKEVKDARK